MSRDREQHVQLVAPFTAALSMTSAWLAAITGQWSLLVSHWEYVAVLVLLACGCAVAACLSLRVTSLPLAAIMSVAAMIRVLLEDQSTLETTGCAILADWLILLTCHAREERWQNPLRLGSLTVGMLASVVVDPPIAVQSLLLLVFVTGLLWRDSTGFAHTLTGEVAGPLLLATLVVGAWAASRMVLDESGVGGTSRGLLASSGGSTSYDARSTRGIGDGEDEADSPFDPTAGFDDSNTFMDSNLETLYDLFTESFGEPKPLDTKRAIALKQEEARIAHGRDEFDGRSGHRFEVRRKPPRRRSGPAPDADALLVAMQGGPLHLRLQTFDRFDGDGWSTIRSAPIRPSLYRDEFLSTSRHPWWTLVDQADSVAARGSHRVKLRVVRYRGHALPLPPITRKFCLGQVDDISFFCEAAGGVLALRDRDLPPGSVIESIDERMDWTRLDDGELMRWPGRGGTRGDLEGLPESTRAMVRRWIEGKRRGWDEVRAVLDALRAHAALDREADYPVDDDVVETLLVTQRRGNSQHFATAAAVILSELGYVTRFATGFYLDPGKYDPAHGQTPLHAEDLHCWPEIRLTSMLWVPLEATPGYEVESAVPSSWERLAEYRVLAGSVGVVAGLAWLGRRRLVDLADHAVTRWADWFGYGPSLTRLVQFLDRRLQRVGCPRPPSRTIGEHLQSVGVRVGVPPTQLAALVTAIEQWQFGPGHREGGSGVPAAHLRAIAARWFSWRALASLGRRRPPNVSMEEVAIDTR